MILSFLNNQRNVLVQTGLIAVLKEKERVVDFSSSSHLQKQKYLQSYITTSVGNIFI